MKKGCLRFYTASHCNTQSLDAILSEKNRENKATKPGNK